jgi:hypothetical protein
MKVMEINELYKAILSVGGLTADSEGYVSVTGYDIKDPFMVDGKRLVLPTREQLANPDKSKVVLFHPLNENLMNGESTVLAKFRRSINIRANYVVSMLMQELMTLITSVKMHPRLSPDQQVLLSAVKDADEKTLTALSDLIKAVSKDVNNKAFVKIFTKKRAVINDKVCHNAAIVSFPFYEDLIALDEVSDGQPKEKTLYGVSLRIKDKQSIAQLLRFVFPDIEHKGSYSQSVSSNKAPILESLMKSVMGIGGPINSIVKEYGDFIEGCEEHVYDSSWVETFDDLSVMDKAINSIPSQAGNEGTRPDLNQPAPVVYQQPLVTPQPAVYNSNPQYQPALQYGQYQQPQPVMQQPPMQPAIVETENGVSWNSAMNSNPMLRNHVMASSMHAMPMQHMQPQRQPSWAINPQQPMHNHQYPQQPMQPQSWGNPMQQPQHNYPHQQHAPRYPWST